MTSCRTAPPLPPLNAERQVLVAKWRRYALMLAQKWCHLAHQEPHVEDIRAEALLGLVEGAQRWDPKCGSFTAIAHYYILNRLRRYEREGVRVVRLPSRLELAAPKEVSMDARLSGADGIPGDATRHQVLPAPAASDRLEEEDSARLFAQLEDTLVMYWLAIPTQAPKPGREDRARRYARCFIGHEYLGQTLEELGAQEGVSRERARQCIGLMQLAFNR